MAHLDCSILEMELDLVIVKPVYLKQGQKYIGFVRQGDLINLFFLVKVQHSLVGKFLHYYSITCLMSPLEKNMMTYPLVKYYFRTPVSNTIYFPPSAYTLVVFLSAALREVCILFLGFLVSSKYFLYSGLFSLLNKLSIILSVTILMFNGILTKSDSFMLGLYSTISYLSSSYDIFLFSFSYTYYSLGLQKLFCLPLFFTVYLLSSSSIYSYFLFLSLFC